MEYSGSMDNSFCTYCGGKLIPGTSICEGCGKHVPKPSNTDGSTNQLDQSSNSMFKNEPLTQTPANTTNQTVNQPDLNDPRVKRNIVEFVNTRPKLLTFSEIKEVFLAYLVIYIGFISRRIFFSNIDIFDAVFETIALILGIFGVWLLIDKFVSYWYNLYPQFKFDPDRIIMSMIFAFIFIGFPPSYFRYRIWVKKLPKPNNVMKIQYISNITLILYGYIWYFLLFTHSLPDIFLFFPFIIGISVGIGILPVGNFRLILTWNRFLYFLLISLTAILIIVSLPMLFKANA